MKDAAAWSRAPTGVTVRLRATPKSARDGLEGVETRADGLAMFKARVRAAPEDGKANAALIRLLAEAVGAPQRAVALVSGAQGRVKLFRIEGDPAAIEARLTALATAAKSS